MPPKRKAKAAPAPAPKPLADCKIAFAYARFPAAGVNGSTLADYQSKITASGGQYTAEVDQCSHLIASEAQYKKKPARLAEAIQKDDVAIVSFDWLDQSLAAGTKIDETQYLIHVRDTNGQADSAAGSKRARSASVDDDNDKSTVKKIKTDPDKPSTEEDARDNKPGSVNIPLDDEMPDKDSYRVHVAEDGTVFDVTLNQTNAGHNNNKFYRIQLVSKQSKSFWCWTRWGRVGERGQMKMLGNGDFDLAFREFQKKFKDKNGNNWDNRLDPIKSGKYSYIERSYEDSSDEEDAGPSKAEKRLAAKGQLSDGDDEKPVESKLPEQIQRLMQLIFNQQYFDSTLASLDYDATKMPLGKLSKNTLLRGYAVLKELATLVSNSTGGGDVADKSNQYFSLIPHAFGRSRPPVLSSMVLIKKEITLLESLTDMQLANEIMKEAKGKKNGTTGTLNVLDRQYNGLGMQEMTPLASSSTEFQELEGYLINSSGFTHNMAYKVQDIFRIERQGENDRFDQSKFAGLDNTDRRLLWHGSRCTNFGGILSQGLRIAPPEAPVTGYMFGKGVYLADMSSKSANYCASYTSGGIGLLLLCEAELGKPPFKQTNANYNAGDDAASQGAISTIGVGRTVPQGWKDASCVHDGLKGVLMPDVLTQPPGTSTEIGAHLQYNEYIVYDVAQIKLRYLLRVKIN